MTRKTDKNIPSRKIYEILYTLRKPIYYYGLIMEKQCLILGPQNVGKTLLIKRLQTLSSDEQHKKGKHMSHDHDDIDLPPPTQPTTGTTLVSIMTPHGSLLLKEYGGKMAPLWAKALPKADMLLYIIDTGNPWQLGVAIVLLMETLSNTAMTDKHILLFFNKSDMPSSLSLQEFKSISRVDDLRMKYDNLLTVISGSCLTFEGLNNILEWLYEKRSELK